MIAALEKWSEFVDYQNNQDKAENYMKWKGSRRLVKMLEDFDTKQKAGGWDKWVEVIMHQRKREQNKSATDIERVARGFMGRRRVLNICTLEQRLRRLVLCAALWAALGAVFCVLLCTTSQACTNIPNILDTLCLDLYSYLILFSLSFSFEPWLHPRFPQVLVGPPLKYNAWRVGDWVEGGTKPCTKRIVERGRPPSFNAGTGGTKARCWVGSLPRKRKSTIPPAFCNGPGGGSVGANCAG